MGMTAKKIGKQILTGGDNLTVLINPSTSVDWQRRRCAV